MRSSDPEDARRPEQERLAARPGPAPGSADPRRSRTETSRAGGSEWKLHLSAPSVSPAPGTERAASGTHMRASRGWREWSRAGRASDRVARAATPEGGRRVSPSRGGHAAPGSVPTAETQPPQRSLQMSRQAHASESHARAGLELRTRTGRGQVHGTQRRRQRDPLRPARSRARAVSRRRLTRQPR